MPADVILLIDEAYAEFTDHLGEQMFDLVERGDTVVTRSFSKAHALAGQRIGWGLFPPSIGKHARKLLTAGGVTAVSCAAAAASMRDPGHVAARRYKNVGNSGSVHRIDERYRDQNCAKPHELCAAAIFRRG